MSRKDYQIIASVLRRAYFDPSLDSATVETLAASLTVELGKDNPRFDSDRFLSACGIESSPQFLVIENTPGYMPESEPAEFDSYSDAVAYANELADELEAQGYSTDRSVASRDNFYAISAERSDTVAPDLGRSIEVIRADS